MASASLPSSHGVTFQGVLALSPESRRSAVVRHVDQQGLTVDDAVFNFGAAASSVETDGDDAASSTRFPFALVASTSFDLGATIIQPLVAEAVNKGSQTAVLLMVPASTTSMPSSAYASLTAMLTSALRRVSDAEQSSGSYCHEPVVRAARPAGFGGAAAVDVFASASEQHQQQYLASFTEMSAAPRDEGWEHWIQSCWFQHQQHQHQHQNYYYSSAGSDGGADNHVRLPSVVLLNAGASGGHVLIAVAPVPSSEFLASVVAMQASTADGLPSMNAVFRGGSPAHLLANQTGSSSNSRTPPFATFLLDFLRSYFAHPSCGTCVAVGVPDLDACAPSALHPLAREHATQCLRVVSALHGAPTTTRLAPPLRPNPTSTATATASSLAGSGRVPNAASASADDERGKSEQSSSSLISLKMLGGKGGPLMSSFPSPVFPAAATATGAAASSSSLPPAVAGTVAFHQQQPTATTIPVSAPASANSSFGVVVVDMDAPQEEPPHSAKRASNNDNNNNNNNNIATSMTRHHDSEAAHHRPATAQAHAALAALRAARQSGLREDFGGAIVQPPPPLGDGVRKTPQEQFNNISAQRQHDDFHGHDGENNNHSNLHGVSPSSAAMSSSSSGNYDVGDADDTGAQRNYDAAIAGTRAAGAVPSAFGAALPVFGTTATTVDQHVQDSVSRNALNDSDSRLSGFITGAGSGSMTSLFEQQQQVPSRAAGKHQAGNTKLDEVRNSRQQSNNSNTMNSTNRVRQEVGNTSALVSSVVASSAAVAAGVIAQPQQPYYLDPVSVSRLQHVSVLESELRTVRDERDELSNLLRKMSVRLTRAQDAAAAKTAECGAASARVAQLEEELRGTREKLDEAVSLLKKEQRDNTVAGQLARKHALKNLEIRCGLREATAPAPSSSSFQHHAADGSVSPAPLAATAKTNNVSGGTKNTTRTSSGGTSAVSGSNNGVAQPQQDSGAALLVSLQLANDRLRDELRQERDAGAAMKAALLSTMQQREKKKKTNRSMRYNSNDDNITINNNSDDEEDGIAASLNVVSPASVFDLAAQALSRGIDIVSSRHSLTVSRDGGVEGSNYNYAAAAAAAPAPTMDRTADALNKLRIAVERLQGGGDAIMMVGGTSSSSSERMMQNVPRVVASETDVIAVKFALQAESTRLKHLDGLMLPFGALLQQTIAAADASFSASLFPVSPQATNPVRDTPHAGTPLKKQHSAAAPVSAPAAAAASDHSKMKQLGASSATAKKSKYIGASAMHPSSAAAAVGRGN